MERPKMIVRYMIGYKSENGWKYERYKTQTEALDRMMYLIEWYDQMSFKRTKSFSLKG